MKIIATGKDQVLIRAERHELEMILGPGARVAIGTTIDAAVIRPRIKGVGRTEVEAVAKHLRAIADSITEGLGA